MRAKQNITIASNLCTNSSEKDHHQLRESTIVHEKPLRNALGDNFLEILTPERVRTIFERM